MLSPCSFSFGEPSIEGAASFTEEPEEFLFLIAVPCPAGSRYHAFSLPDGEVDSSDGCSFMAQK
ncbi:hypothetical protein NC653_005102 [Populus alba x Populus x berolinensis]|uniref:Uncharacterized protein n=1 Tax=Populus alba x Populus x berolinensis TaxID=444605 RepID=A0AAD6WCP0_9ROSI|nr:hypothetical protein NC653_005102 [Populus alba x Populus x berolinensis]